MILSLLLALLITISGALATYLFDEETSLGSRLCTGACIGFAAFGLIGFIFASLFGLTPFSILLTVLFTSAPCVLLLVEDQRRIIEADFFAAFAKIKRSIGNPTASDVGYAAFYVMVAIFGWFIFDRAMIVKPEGVYTGVLNNFGDLPFHLSVISSFAFGQNYPPEDPTFAGVRFTYPFLTDFISAVFVRCGASLRAAMLIENIFLFVAFVGVLHRWAWALVRDRAAAIITPLLVILNGGFGWALLLNFAAKNENGLYGVLTHLPPSFTVIPETTWRWGNAISSLLVPQRGILLGLPLAVIVFTQWWLATQPDSEKETAASESSSKGSKKKPPENKKQDRGAQKLSAGSGANGSRLTGPTSSFSALISNPMARMVAAGIVAGLLPLTHAHSFVVVMGVGACLALLQRSWRLWITFAVVASAIAIPQMWWSTRHSAVNAASFFAWEFGWDHGKDNPVWFWFKNTGIFVPLLVVAILWRSKEYLVPRRLLLFYLPFTLCFIVPNMVKLAPWIWDNVKVLFYWWLASAPLVALVISRLWNSGFQQRLLAAGLLVCLTLAGALDVASIVTRSGEYQLFDPYGVRFAEVVKEQTQPRSLVMHAPVHNTPVFLSGRRSLMGYPGHIWTHGLEFGPRENEIKRIYAGAPDAEALLAKYDVDYAVVGPLEKLALPVNEQFFTRFKKVGEAGEYRLYKIKP
jgi:hypothetical protein